MSRRFGFCVAVVAAMLGSSREAEAELQENDFDWSAPPGCPSRDTVLATVRGIARNDIGSPPHVEASVTGPPWRARVVVDREGERGARQLEASTCEALGRAVALVTALAIDRAESAPGPPPSPPLENAGLPGEGANRPERPRPDHVSGLLGVTASSGFTPNVAMGAEAGLAYRAPLFTHHALELGLRFAIFAPVTTRMDAERVGGSFWLVLGELRGGWAVRLTRSIDVVPSVGLATAYLRGESRSATENDNAHDFLPTPFAGLEGRLRLWQGGEAYLDANAGLPMGRAAFRLRGVDQPLHSPAVVVARLGAGLRLSFF